MGERFSKTYSQIPLGTTLVINATGEQTGETISSPRRNWWISGEKASTLSFNNPLAAGVLFGAIHVVVGASARAFANEGTGKRLSDARVTVKIEVRKNGVQVYSRHVTAPKSAEITAEVTHQRD